MDQYSLIVRGILPTMLLASSRADILIAVDEVGDDLDVILDVKHVDGAGTQVLRDCGDAIALLNGKTREREKKAVQAQQRNVGTVQGRHKGQVTSRWRRGQHLPGQHRAYGMRNRVVHMQQV